MELEAAVNMKTNFSEIGNTSCSDDDINAADLRRGPWTVDEDLALFNYIAAHGEGRWNSLARSAGLKRTGKSCRLRWLNYLRPDVRRGNITLREQLLILELHSRWGNRWSKIAQFLPGRTDNEIKNYWRTRVQKHAKQLKCDVNSKKFKDAMRYLWMPRLVERIQAAETANAVAAPPAGYPTPVLDGSVNTGSSDTMGAHVSSTSDFGGGSDGNYGYQVGGESGNWCQLGDYVADTLTSDCGYGFEGQGWMAEQGSDWTTSYGGVGDTSEISWNVEDIFVFSQQLGNGGVTF